MSIALAALAITALVGVSGAAAQNATSIGTGDVEPELTWFPSPSILAGGARIAVVSRDPFARGSFTIGLEMPDDYILPPHTNPSSEHVVVKSGSLVVGAGRKMNLKKSLVLTAGDTASVPAGTPHWSIARGITRILVTEDRRPYGIAYMSVRDEPIGHAFPNGF